MARKKEKMNWNWNCDGCGKKKIIHHSSSGVYFLGFIGAAVYYIQQASTFSQGFVGILKAIVWPAFLVYKLFGIEC